MNASDAAAALHERTKHTWQRLRTEAHGPDWGNHPFPFKLYPDLEPLALPRQLPESSLPATQVLSGHTSALASALDLAGLARLKGLPPASSSLPGRPSRDGEAC